MEDFIKAMKEDTEYDFTYSQTFYDMRKDDIGAIMREFIYAVHDNKELRAQILEELENLLILYI